jgi:hypothetical protein
MGWSEFSTAQREYVQCINDRLMLIERQVKREALALIAQLEARVHDPDDWLSDYEIELEVSFWLREDEPAYKEEDDNILVTLREYLTLLRTSVLLMTASITTLRTPWMATPCKASSTAGSIIAYTTIPHWRRKTCCVLDTSWSICRSSINMPRLWCKARASSILLDRDTQVSPP